jgi:hypothetical protein
MVSTIPKMTPRQPTRVCEQPDEQPPGFWGGLVVGEELTLGVGEEGSTVMLSPFAVVHRRVSPAISLIVNYGVTQHRKFLPPAWPEPRSD